MMPCLPNLARAAGLLVVPALLLISFPPRGPGQAVAPEVLSPNEQRLLQALAADPRTSPFVYSTRVRNGRVELSGRVGSASYHAAAMEVALATGIPFTDRLLIDTAELARVPRPAVQAAPTVVLPYPLLGTPVMDPLFGLQPPLVAYPAWWPAMSARRLADSATVEAAPARAPNIVIPPAPGAAPTPAPPPAIARPVPPPPPPGNVDPEPPKVSPPPPQPQVGAGSLSSTVLAALQTHPNLADRDIHVDNHGGRITLSGEVASTAEAFDAFQTARHTPGVREVFDQLRYPVPAPDHPNPLVRAKQPEDVAAFLMDHVARQLAQGATLREIDIQDQHLRIGIALDASRNPEQVAAVLRSMPLLRGFALSIDFGDGAVRAK